MKNYKIIDRKINVLITVHLHQAEISQTHCDRYRENTLANIFLGQQTLGLRPYRHARGFSPALHQSLLPE